jgi:TRAP-type uncharacterized transport system substrate-binding protein
MVYDGSAGTAEEANMTTAIEVHGVCDDRFRAVEEAFAENFASHGEVGAAVAVSPAGRR